MIEIRRNLSPLELKVFGLGLGLLFSTLAAWLVWRADIVWFPLPAAIALAGWVFASFAWIWPAALLRIYVGWMYAVLPIGWTVSHLVMALIYYGMMTPVGLVMRLLGYDPMQRKFDPARESYWERRPELTDPRRYFRQY